MIAARHEHIKCDLESLFAWLRSTFFGLRDFHFFGFVLILPVCVCVKRAEQKTNRKNHHFLPQWICKNHWIKNTSKTKCNDMKCSVRCAVRWCGAEMHSMEPWTLKRWAYTKEANENKVQNASQTNIYVLQQIIHAIVGNHKSLATHQTISTKPRNISQTEKKRKKREKERKNESTTKNKCIPVCVYVLCLQCCRHSFVE